MCETGESVVAAVVVVCGWWWLAPHIEKPLFVHNLSNQAFFPFFISE